METLPQTIDRYQVRELLGAGAFGVVYRAWDPLLNRDIALKVLKTGVGASPHALERFLREARAAAKLNHPNVVPVHDAGSDGDSPYIVSKFIEGRTLGSAIPTAGMEPRQAAELAVQLASALGHLHQQEILHRDVKPQNAMLDKNGALHLMDFGLAGLVCESSTRLTQDGALLGTPRYMSPEQASRKTLCIGRASDVYGAGVVLYQMLTGRLPFESDDLETLLKQIQETPPPPPRQHRPDLDVGLEAICLKAIAKKPEDRYGNGEEMAAALRGWLSRDEEAKAAPAVQRPKSPSGPSRPGWAGKRRVLWSFASLALLAVLAGVAVGYALLPSIGKGRTDGEAKTDPPGATKDKPIDVNEPPRAVAPFDAAEAKRLQQAWAEHLGVPMVREADLGRGMTMKLVLIPPGSFQMGSPEGDNHAANDEMPQHWVEITRPFDLGIYPVTKGQFAAFVEDDGYKTEAEKTGDRDTWRSGFSPTDEHPVVNVTWNDAQRFCAWLSKKEDKVYELPTEAEWEYACRAGTTTAYLVGDDPSKLRDYAWYVGNSDDRMHAVGTRKPNPWGLFDMPGNVWQWCADRYRLYREEHIKDPKGADSGEPRAHRGGSFASPVWFYRSAYRHYIGFAPPRNSEIGFRVVLRSAARTP